MANLIQDLHTPRAPHWRQQPLKSLAHVMTDANVDENGILRWNMGNIVPADVTELAAAELPSLGVDVEATAEARDAHQEAFLAEYFENQANRTEEQIAEERFEMQAAFGKGETVVNILTGEKTYL